MAVAKRKTAKKAVTQAAPAKARKAAPLKAPASSTKTKKAPIKKTETVKTIKIATPSKAYTQSELVQKLTETTGLTRKDIKAVFEHMRLIIKAHLGNKGPGLFTLPGLVKLTVKSKPATKARKGTNPFTGEEMTFKAKPARKDVKARALKKLRELVEAKS